MTDLQGMGYLHKILTIDKNLKREARLRLTAQHKYSVINSCFIYQSEYFLVPHHVPGTVHGPKSYSGEEAVRVLLISLE